MLNHRNGTKFEDLAFVDSKTGRVLIQTQYHVESQVMPTKAMRRMVEDAESRTIIGVHNHPNNSVPSISDLRAAKRYKYGVIVCHNGVIMKYSVDKDFNELFADHLLDKINLLVYTESNTDKLENTLSVLSSIGIHLEVLL